MYTIPLRGLPEFNKGSLFVGDIGITSQENDNVFNRILEGAESIVNGGDKVGRVGGRLLSIGD